MELKFDIYRRHHWHLQPQDWSYSSKGHLTGIFGMITNEQMCVPRSLCEPKNSGSLWRLRSVWRQRHDYWMMSRMEEGKGAFDQDDYVKDGGYGIVDTGKEWSGRWRNWGCFAGDGVSRGKIGVVPSPIKIHYPCTNVLVSLHLGFLLPPQGLLLTKKRSKVSLI